jgi:hypothetical protein
MDPLIVTLNNAKGLIGVLVSVTLSAIAWGAITFGLIGGGLLAYKLILLGH